MIRTTSQSIAPNGVRNVASPVMAQASTANYAAAPTITDVASSTSSIASSTLIGFDNAAFTHLGAGLQVASDTRFLTITTPNSNLGYVTFCTDAPVFEVFFAIGTFRWYVEVSDNGLDGFQPAGSVLPTGSAGAASHFKIDFAGVRRARSFRISTHRGYYFGGIRVLATDSVWPLVDTRKLMLFNGDSYTDGTGASGRHLTYAGTMARLLNYRFFSEGIGGTGYITAGGNSLATRVATYNNNLQQRVAAVNSAVTPDVVAWAYGYNDSGAADATIQAGFDAAYAAATTKPNLIIGPWMPQGSTGGLSTVRSLLIAKAAQHGIPFLDLLGWMNSSNNQVLNNYPGDPVHPIAIGHDYLGFRMAQAARLLGF